MNVYIVFCAIRRANFFKLTRLELNFVNNYSILICVFGIVKYNTITKLMQTTI